MRDHGNSLQNMNPHHLYEIRDMLDNEVLKFGISDDPVDKDGLSNRLRVQVDFLNRAVGFIRFLGKILLKNIAGRVHAKKIEDQYIDDFQIEFGKRPRGNPVGGKIK